MNVKEELKTVIRWLGDWEKVVTISSIENKVAVALAIVDSHDLVPVDSGPFRPEEHGFIEAQENVWRDEESNYHIIKTNSGQAIIREIDQDSHGPFLTLYNGRWPSRAFALLLLQELGIGGGK